MAGSTLPDQIPPQAEPFSYQDLGGKQIIETHWYLFLYGLWTQVQSAQSGGVAFPAVTAIPIIDTDVIGTDSAQTNRQLANLAALLTDAPDVAASALDVANLQALFEPLVERPAQAQLAQAVTVGASVFTYTAPANGTLSITGGTVSVITIVRQGVSVATGLILGLVPVSQFDQVQITYAVLPTVVFLPQ